MGGRITDMAAIEGLEAESVLRVPQQVLSRTASDETVLLNLDSEEYFGLDAIGNRLWELLQAGTTFGEAISVLLEEYEVERTVLEADISALIADLVEHGLVEVDAS